MQRLALWPLLLLTVSAGASADLKSDLQRRYDKIAAAVAASDVSLAEKALKACVTPDFIFIDPFKLKRDVVAYSGLLIEFALPNGPKTKRFRIQSVTQKGSTAIVLVRSEAPGAKGKSATVRTSRDTWTKSHGQWRLKRVEFTAPASSLGIG